MLASEILSIPPDRPELLFERDDVEGQFKRLMKSWHPDVCRHPDAQAVTSKINQLHALAQSRIDDGSWDGRMVLTLHGTDGKKRRVRYRAHHTFELGDLYYGDKCVAYVVSREHSGLYRSGVSTITTLHFADDKMRDEVGKLLPHTISSFDTREGNHALILEKRERVYTLFDLLGAMGRVPPEHAAWITSCLLNICCYLEWAGTSHGDISLDTVFVEPSTHSAYLLGGWWYAHPHGQELTHLPVRSVRLAPRRVLTEKRIEDSTLDLTLVKMIGRELLGFPTGQNPPVGTPTAMVDFLRQPPMSSARAEYRFWRETILPASFDTRRYVELDIDPSDVFKQQGV